MTLPPGAEAAAVPSAHSEHPSDPDQTAPRSSHTWRRYALGAAGAMFTGMGIGRFSYTTMVPALVKADALDAVQAGRVGMVNLGGFLIGALVSVPLARSIGRRRCVLMTLLLCLALLALSALPFGGIWLAVCRGGIGIATGLMMVMSLALVAETAPADRRAEASGYMFAGVGLGILSSALLVPLLLEAELWLLWAVLAVAALIGASIAAWGWWHAPEPPAAMRAAAKTPEAAAIPVLPSIALKLLLAAHLLFSVGLVPHTLYWVDYLRRGIAVPAAAVALNWGLVGLFSFLGPLLAALLARLIGTSRALVTAFAIIGLGIALPIILETAGIDQPATPQASPYPALGSFAGCVLLASSVLFGAQPGLSSLLAARVRDLGAPEQMGRIMRVMILANASGGLIGGLAVPWLYGRGWSQPALFVIGGAAMLLAAVVAWPVAADRGQARGAG